MRPKPNSKEQGGIVTTLIALLFVMVLCVAVYLVRHPIMRFAAEEWIVDEPAAHADAIIVLSDDNFYADRATHAAELYRQGVAPVVVASGRRLRPSAGISELMEHDLVERGVPKDKIIRYAHDADNTREEAEMIGKIAKANHWKSVVIVTSNYHTRRARYIFGKVAPAGITVSIASARDGDFDPERWWEKRKSVKLFTREIAGMAVAMWELKAVSRSVSGSVAAEHRMILPDQTCSLGHIPGKAVACPLHHISATLSLRF